MPPNYSLSERDGRTYARRIGKTGLLEVCPRCFDATRGGGIIVDGACTYCGYARNFEGELQKREQPKHEPYTGRKKLSWTEKINGRTLMEWLGTMDDLGMDAAEIAEGLTKIAEYPIGIANVRTHRTMWRRRTGQEIRSRTSPKLATQ